MGSRQAEGRAVGFLWGAAASLWGTEDPVAVLHLLLRWAPGCLLAHKEEGLDALGAGFTGDRLWVPPFLPCSRWLL